MTPPQQEIKTAEDIAIEVAERLVELPSMNSALFQKQTKVQDAQRFILSAITAALASIEQENQRLRALEFQPKVEQYGTFLGCGHNSYWLTHYDTCMACRVGVAEQENQRLREALGNLLDALDAEGITKADPVSWKFGCELEDSIKAAQQALATDKRTESNVITQEPLGKSPRPLTLGHTPP